MSLPRQTKSDRVKTDAADDDDEGGQNGEGGGRGGDFDDHVGDDECDEENEFLGDKDDAEEDEDEEDDEEENTDDGLMQQLFDAVQENLDLAKAIIGKCQRAGILSDDVASPTVYRHRPQNSPSADAAAAAAANDGESAAQHSATTVNVHPLIELAFAIADVNYLALTEKNRLANLSMGMRQAYLVPWLRALSQRAMLLAATGNFDEAVDHAMEMLSIDDTRTDALGIAVAIARARLQMGQPEPETYLEELVEFCRGIIRSRMSPLVSRRQATRLERILRALIDEGRVNRERSAAAGSAGNEQ